MKKKKTTIHDGLVIRKSGVKNKRWKITESGLTIGEATEGYNNLIDLRANLASIHKYTSPANIERAIAEFKSKK